MQHNTFTLTIKICACVVINSVSVTCKIFASTSDLCSRALYLNFLCTVIVLSAAVCVVQVINGWWFVHMFSCVYIPAEC